MKNSSIFTLLILSLFCINVSAAARTYKIELVIFSQDMPTTEEFDQIESLIEWPRRLVNRNKYSKVSSRKLSLHGAYSQLARSHNYQPIMHVGWIQSVQSNSLGRAVKISNSTATIDGFIQLQRGHLAYMIVDLEYSLGSVIYRLNEKRRFKLNETHYLDHPKFGVLVRISPIK